MQLVPVIKQNAHTRNQTLDTPLCRTDTLKTDNTLPVKDKHLIQIEFETYGPSIKKKSEDEAP